MVLMVVVDDIFILVNGDFSFFFQKKYIEGEPVPYWLLVRMTIFRIKII